MDTGAIRGAVQAFLDGGQIACQLTTAPDVPQVLALGADNQGYGAQIPLLLAVARGAASGRQALRPRLEPPPTTHVCLPTLCLPRHGCRVPMTLATPPIPRLAKS